jgi:hypothetical protein
LWKLQLWLSTKVINCSTCSWPLFPTQCYPRDFSFKLQIESSLTFDSVLKRSLFWVIYELGTSPRDISRTVVCCLHYFSNSAQSQVLLSHTLKHSSKQLFQY